MVKFKLEKRQLQAAFDAINEKDNRYYLNGAALITKDGETNMYGTNGHYVYGAKMPKNVLGVEIPPSCVIIPKFKIPAKAESIEFSGEDFIRFTVTFLDKKGVKLPEMLNIETIDGVYPNIEMAVVHSAMEASRFAFNVNYIAAASKAFGVDGVVMELHNNGLEYPAMKITSLKHHDEFLYVAGMKLEK